MSSYIDQKERINVDKPRYNQENYINRLYHMLEICGPPSWKTLFTTEEELQAALKLLDDYKKGLIIDIDEEDIWRAKQIKDTIIHPDSGRKIPWPFRMSAHVLMNTILLLGMLSTGTYAQMFWQFNNQSFNALQFYANRNATNNIDDKTLAMSYVGAVSGSVGAVYSLNILLDRLNKMSVHNSRTLRLIPIFKRLVPFLSVSISKPLQIGLMRQDELIKGVSIRDDKDNHLGNSVIAGRKAVSNTIFTRVLYLIQPMIFAPLILMQLAKMKRFQSSPLLYGITNVAIISSSSAIATPMCIALFEQRASISPLDLEKEYQSLPFEGVYYNKGL